MKTTKAIKALLSFSALTVITSILVSFLPVRGEDKIYTGVVRLHVIAASDSERDQSLKLMVRDAILNEISGDEPGSFDDAKRTIESRRDEIKKCAERTLADAGCGDAVEVYFDRESYPERVYEGFTLPAGDYLSLRVVIGEGEGHNWWCVVFPPLCTATSEKEQKEDFIAAGFTNDQYKLINNSSGVKYKVRFKILEILADVFGIDY